MSHFEIIKRKEEVLLVDGLKLFILDRIETLSGQVYWYHKEKNFDEEDASKLEMSYKINKRDSKIDSVLK